MRVRLIPSLLAGVCTAVLLAACAETPTTQSPSSSLAPEKGPSFGYVTPYGCAVGNDISGCGLAGDGVVHKEQLQVCKQYPAGTVNPPAVQVQLDVTSENAPRGPQTGLIFTIQPNSCLILWQNGQDFGPNPDYVTVTELAPAGYTPTSQITTIVRVGPRGPGETYTTTVNPSTSATTVQGVIGGMQVPGMLVVFTNTAIPTTGPGCTRTQGYWKNHESAWPAPYSATAPWLKAGNLVTGLTWDGLMETPPKGGNSYVQLAHQWIAATLNVANGTSAPSNVQSTLSLAEAWLVANTPANGSLPSIKNDQATAWAGVLDSYNNGLLGPQHCK